MEYAVDITVIEIRGKGICPRGHKISDTFKIEDSRLCPWAMHAILPFATALRFGGLIPWKETNADSIDLCCPDPDNPVVFRLKRRPLAE